MKNLLILLLLACFSTSNWALEVRNLSFTQTEKNQKNQKFDQLLAEDPYFQIEAVTVTQLEDPMVIEDNSFTQFSPSLAYKSNAQAFAKDLGTWIMNLEKLIAFGTKVWEIVKKGRPVVNVNMAKPISVLPVTEDPRASFSQMSNWSAPKAARYRVEYKNGFGSKVISFDYTVYFQHGGQFNNKGQYLTGVTVKASNVAVSWGFQFDASSELETISNRGSLDDPNAGATINIDYKASSVFRDITSSESFHVTGSGEILKF